MSDLTARVAQIPRNALWLTNVVTLLVEEIEALTKRLAELEGRKTPKDKAA